MHPIDIIASVGAVVVLLKLLVLLLAKDSIKSLTKSLTKHPEKLRWTYGILAAIVGFYVYRFMGIVPLFVGLIFGSLFLKMIMMSYPKSVKIMADESLEKIDWFSVIVVAVLAVWVLKVLFF